jgi:hypothetical protein
MHPKILNRDFQHPADGWYQIEALGHHPNRAAGVVQVIDAGAAQAIVDRFNAEAAAGQLRHGQEMLIDHEHFSDQPDQETRAYGWLLQLQNRAAGIYGRIRWTTTGQAAVDGGDYRFFSTEYEPHDLQPLAPASGQGSQSSFDPPALKPVRPLRLAGLTLTNMNNNRGQQPITNRSEAGLAIPPAPIFADAGSRPADLTKTNTKGKPMKSVCTLLGLSAEADEASVHAAVSKLLNRGDITPDALTTLQHRAAALESENQTLLGEQLAGLLAERKVTDAKIVNRLTPVLAALKNREERLAALDDFGFTGQASQAAPAAQTRVLNRGAQAGSEAAAASVTDDDRAIATKIQNRATEIQAKGTKFDAAWRQASREVLGRKY